MSLTGAELDQMVGAGDVLRLEALNGDQLYPAGDVEETAETLAVAVAKQKPWIREGHLENGVNCGAE